MGLRLHTVPAKRGAHWIKQAFVTWWRRPLGFIGLFMFLLFGAMLLMTIPVVGGLLGLGLLPLLTLGFMIATRSALQGGPVHAMQAFEGLRGIDPRRRNAQLLLCALYALASIGVIEFAEWIDEGLFMQLQRAMATTGSTPDIFTIPVNLAGTCAMSVPAGCSPRRTVYRSAAGRLAGHLH